MNVLVDATGRITATSAEFHLGEGEFGFDFPADFAFATQDDWRIENGQLVFDPLPRPEPVPAPAEARLRDIEAALCELAELIVGGV